MRAQTHPFFVSALTFKFYVDTYSAKAMRTKFSYAGGYTVQKIAASLFSSFFLLFLLQDKVHGLNISWHAQSRCASRFPRNKPLCRPIAFLPLPLLFTGYKSFARRGLSG